MSKDQLWWLRVGGLGLAAAASVGSVVALHLAGATLLALCAAASALGVAMAGAAWAVDRARQATWRRG